MVKKSLSNRIRKEAGVTIVLLNKIDIKLKFIRRVKERFLILLLVLLIYSVMYYILTIVFFFLPPISSLPIYSSSSYIFLQSRAGLPGISSKHGTSICNKIMHLCSYQGWTRQSSRKTMIPKAGKNIRNSLHLFWVPHKQQPIQLQHAESLGYTHSGPLTANSVSVYP